MSVVVATMLVFGLAQPAQAQTTFGLGFTGTMTFSGPLGNTCVGPNGTVDLLLCTTRAVNMHPPNGDTTPTILTVTLTLHPSPTGTQVSPDYHHNRRTVFQFTSTTCAWDSLNVNKAGKASIHTNNNCSFGLTAGPLPNTAAGWCELMSGQVALNFNDGLGQTYSFDVHFHSAGKTAQVTGHWRKLTGNQQGLLRGTMTITPPTGAQSCAQKTARTFGIAGGLVGTLDPSLTF